MQKQTKPEPLGKSMAKLVLVIAVIVFLGTVAGVAVWAVKNKPETILPVTPHSQEEITIATDKTEYEQGEIVKITIKNNLGQNIGYWDYSGQFAPSFRMQHFLNWKWESIQPKSICACKTDCTTYANGWVELKSKDAIIDSWDTKEDCTGKSAKDGKYRVLFHYSLDLTSQGDFSIAYSKEFTIKSNVTKDETADWKTYESFKMGFSIKAPPDFEAFLDINHMDTPSKDELISNFLFRDTNDSRDIVID